MCVIVQELRSTTVCALSASLKQEAGPYAGVVPDVHVGAHYFETSCAKTVNAMCARTHDDRTNTKKRSVMRL